MESGISVVSKITPTVKETIAKHVSSTSGLMCFLIGAIIIIALVGIIGYMYLEGHDFQTALKKTMTAAAGREKNEEKIKHEWFGPCFYLLLAMLNAVIAGVIIVEIGKRVFKCGKTYKCATCHSKISKQEAKLTKMGIPLNYYHGSHHCGDEMC